MTTQTRTASGPPSAPPPAGRLNEASANRLLREQIKEIPLGRAIWVMDARGNTVYDSDPGNTGLYFGDRAYFQIFLTQPQTTFYLGAPVRSRTTGRWLISAARPSPRTHGAFAGIIVAALEPIYLDNLWRKLDLGAGSSIALFRRDGVLMMRSPFDDDAMGRSLGDDPLFRVRLPAYPAGTFQDASPIDGKTRIFAYRTLSARPDLMVIVGQSYQLVLAPWRRLATLAVGIWATASLAIVILSVFLNQAWRQRLRSEVRSQHLAERLTLATAATSIAVWDWDVKADKLHASPNYFTMLGYDPEEKPLSREEWLERVHPEDRDTVSSKMEAGLEGADAAYRYEARLRHADGSFRWISGTASVLGRDQDGKAARLVGVREDITVRKLAEMALRESEQRFRDLVHSTDGIVWEADASTFVFSFVSTNAERLLGYPAADWLAPGFWASHIHVEDRDQAVQYCVARTGSLEDHEFEYRFVAQDGRLVWLRDIVRVVQENGKARWLRGLMVDITASKQAQGALQSSLMEKEALLKEVHHRVKNNLQVVTSLLRLETGRSENPGTRSVLKEMQGRIQAMALLHETLYRSATFAEVDLGAYLRQLANQSFRALNAQPGVVRLDLDLASAHVKFDQAIPCGLLVNELISNSLKHGFPSGRSGGILVELLPVGGRLLRLSVSDTGVGLPANFESKRGQSLGLQLVSDLARQLGGRLEIGPGPGTGAVFAVTFPGGEPTESGNGSGRSGAMTTIEIKSAIPE